MCDCLHLVLISCSYLFATLEQQSSVQHLGAFYDQLAQTLKQRYEKQEGCTPALSATIEVSLALFSEHQKAFVGRLDKIAQSLDLSRQCHLEAILRPFENLTLSDLQDRNRRYHLGVSLESLAQYADLLGIHPGLPQSKVPNESLPAIV